MVGSDFNICNIMGLFQGCLRFTEEFEIIHSTVQQDVIAGVMQQNSYYDSYSI